MEDNALVATALPVEEIISSVPPASPVATGELAKEHVDQPPDPAPLKAEIERLERVRKEAEEKAVYWRKQKVEARADYFKGRGDEPPKPPAEDLGIGKEPHQDEYEDYQKYLDAKVSFEINKAKITWDKDQARKNQEESHQQRMDMLRSKIDEGFKKYVDFEEVALSQTVPITPLVMEILADTEKPEDVAYWLGKNRAEAIQISRMTPTQAARAIAKIEIEVSKPGGVPPSLPKITGAPPPINPLGSSHTVEKALEKMTQREFETEMERRTGRRF
uniref:Uncharacterized protein n=1 Tax=viral metagenome TaxID=1070528 RepID=A0A6M3LH84_9ZZZZ